MVSLYTTYTLPLHGPIIFLNTGCALLLHGPTLVLCWMYAAIVWAHIQSYTGYTLILEGPIIFLCIGCTHMLHRPMVFLYTECLLLWDGLIFSLILDSHSYWMGPWSYHILDVCSYCMGP